MNVEQQSGTLSLVTDEPTFVTHEEPADRDRTNFIVQIDLTEHGLPQHFEQYWTHTEDEQRFTLCCIPFFAYGHSLGDVLTVEVDSGRHAVHTKAGHRTIRFTFLDDREAHLRHDALHRDLIEVRCQVEFYAGGHYGAVDIPPEANADQVIALMGPHFRAGYLSWEWADPRAES